MEINSDRIPCIRLLDFLFLNKSSLKEIYHFSSALINRIRLLTKHLLKGHDIFIYTAFISAPM